MYSVIMFLHVLICVLLVIVVLLQQSKGGGMSSVFGGGGGGTDALFGGKGATPFFVKLTTGLAIAFFATSLILVLISRGTTTRSAIEKGLEEMPVQPVIPEEQVPIIPEEPEGGGR